MTYYVIHDLRDDTYVDGVDNDGDVSWCPPQSEPQRFATLMDAYGFIEAKVGHNLPDDERVSIQYVTTPEVGDLVEVRSTGTWFGESVHGAVGRVHGIVTTSCGCHLLDIDIADGFNQPEWRLVWAHEVQPARLRPCSEAVRGERERVAA